MFGRKRLLVAFSMSALITCCCCCCCCTAAAAAAAAAVGAQAVEEEPVRNMATRLCIERGTLQALQKEASVLCGMVECFCRHLQWHELADVLYPSKASCKGLRGVGLERGRECLVVFRLRGAACLHLSVFDGVGMTWLKLLRVGLSRSLEQRTYLTNVLEH